MDDWAAAGTGNDWAEGVACLDRVLHVVAEFERASGTTINKSKSAVVPSRLLSEVETKDCQRVWDYLRVSYRERLLGCTSASMPPLMTSMKLRF